MASDTPIVDQFLQPTNTVNTPALFNFDQKTPFCKNTSFSAVFYNFSSDSQVFFNPSVTNSRRFPYINTDETQLFTKNAIFTTKWPAIPLSLTSFCSPLTQSIHPLFSTLTKKPHFAKTPVFQQFFTTFHQILRFFSTHQ